MENLNYDETSKRLEGEGPEAVLEWAFKFFGPENIAFATSFGAEDQVITDMLVKKRAPVSIFTLDTGRLPQETYDLHAETEKRYGVKIETLFPDRKSVEEMVNKLGPNLFYESVENRKLCCKVRKIDPLRRKLSGYKAWICGLRREQSVTRTAVGKVEPDANFGLVKLNPLADWTEAQVWDYIRKNKVPYSKLHDKGYPSIGCAPCTRAVKPGEHLRAGRWWWEEPEKKECGLHAVDGKLVRKGN